MNLGDLDIPLSVVATIIALLSFFGEAWRLWRDKPRLLFTVRPVTFKRVPKFGDMDYVRFMISNVGYRPLVLTGFMAFGERSSFSMGVDDEPAAIFGHDDQRFPVLLEAGQTLKVHPTTMDALRRNLMEPDNEKQFYDPWKLFVIIDSFGRFHPIDAEMVRHLLGLGSRPTRSRWWQKPIVWLGRKRLLRFARKRVQNLAY